MGPWTLHGWFCGVNLLAHWIGPYQHLSTSSMLQTWVKAQVGKMKWLRFEMEPVMPELKCWLQNEPGGYEMDELWKEKWHTEASKKLTRNPTKTHGCWEVSVEQMSKCRFDPFVCRHSFELHKKTYCPTNGNAFCELHKKTYCPTNGNAFCELHKKTSCPTNGNTFCESYNPIRSCHNCAECDAVPSLDLLDLSGLTFLVAALAECCVECVGPKSVGSQDPSDHGDPPSMRPPLKVRSLAEVGSRIPNHGDHCQTPEMPDLFAQMWPESNVLYGRFWAQKWNHRKLSTSRVSWVKCGHLWYF